MNQFGIKQALRSLKKLKFGRNIVFLYTRCDIYASKPPIAGKFAVCLWKDPILVGYRGFSSFGVPKKSRSDAICDLYARKPPIDRKWYPGLLKDSIFGGYRGFSCIGVRKESRGIGQLYFDSSCDIYVNTLPIARKLCPGLLKDPILGNYRGFSSGGVQKESRGIGWQCFNSRCDLYAGKSLNGRKMGHWFLKDRVLVGYQGFTSVGVQKQSRGKSCLGLFRHPVLGGFRCFSSGGDKESRDVGRSAQAVAKAQIALMEYLHGTRGLDFTDAEHMSKNSPNFLNKLLSNVADDEDVSRAMVRFFRFNPINEFEPFFESIGMKTEEFGLWIPRDLMFLSDDEVLLENYHVLCNYGVNRGKIGRIYREAPEVFRYDFGVLQSKLQSYEKLGFKKSTVCKVVTFSPVLLLDDVDNGFLKVIEELNKIGIPRDWIGSALSECNICNWGSMLLIMRFFKELGFNDQDLETLIRKQPGFLLEDSGKAVFFLVGLVLKSGGTRETLYNLFSQFPNIQFNKFMGNLHHGLVFLYDIEFDCEDIEKIILSHLVVLGSCHLKKPNSVLTYLSTSKGRLRRIVKEDPNQLKKYALGVKINPLPHLDNDERSLKEKRKFLLHLGFTEDSKEMQKALKVFRGKGDELQQRCDLLVNAGLNPVDVCKMLKKSPQILNQTTDVLQRKISFLLTDVGYPLSSLVTFPGYMAYSTEKVNLRFSMYNWLKARGKVKPALALSSILACTENIFVKRYVKLDPEGPEVWKNLKKTLPAL